MEARPPGPDPAAPPAADQQVAAPPPRPAGSRLSGQPSSSGHALSAVQRLMQRNLHRSGKSGQPSQQQLSQREPQSQWQGQEERRPQQNGASHGERQQGHMAAAATAATHTETLADAQPAGQDGLALDASGGASAPECNTGSAGAAAGQAPVASPPAAGVAAGSHNASPSPAPDIVPAAELQVAARQIQLVGVRLKQGSWNARVHLAVDERGRPAGGPVQHALMVGTFGSAAAAAMARDLGMLWRQLSTGASPQALGPKERYHFPIQRLPESLAQQVGGCSCWADLKLLMRQLEAEGVLQQLPAKLAPGSELVLPPAAAEEAAADAAAAQAAGEGGAGQPAATPADGPGPLPQAGAAGCGVSSDEEEEGEAPAAGEQGGASDPAAGEQAERALSSGEAAGGEQAGGPPSNPAAAAAAAPPAAAAAGTSAGLPAAQQGAAETAAAEGGEAAEVAGRAGASAALLTLTGVQATQQGNWQTQIYAPWDGCGRVAAGNPPRQRTTGRFSDRLEAAVARDLSVVWRQLRLGCDPAAAGETFNCPLNSLLQQEALLAQLRECSSLRDLRQLLEGLAVTGHLRRLGATLFAQRTAAVAAVLGQIFGSAPVPQAASPVLAAAGAGAGAPPAMPAVATANHAGGTSAGAAAADASGAVGGAAAGIAAVTAADGTASGSAPIAAMPAGAHTTGTAAASPAVAAGSPAAQAEPASTSGTPARSKAFVGVQQIRNSWLAHVTAGLDEQLRPSGAADKKAYSVGSFGSAEEGAAARDVAVVWRQLVLGASPHKAHEKLNLPLDGLLQQEALLTQLRECPSLRDLRQLLEGLAVTGHLRRLAATLLTQRTAAVAAATGQLGIAAVDAGVPAGAETPVAAGATPMRAAPSTSAAAAAAAAGAEAPSTSAAAAAATVLPKRLYVGLTRQDTGWQAGMWVSLDEQQRPSSTARKTSRSLGCFSSIEEGAIARDIAVVWKQLAVGASPHAASEKLNAPLDSLLQQEALLAQLRECPSLRDLRQLLEGLAATGHLRRLGATLLTQRAAALTAALGGEQAAPAALPLGSPAAAAAPEAKHDAAAEPAASLGMAAGDGQPALAQLQQPSGGAAALAPEPHVAAAEPAPWAAPAAGVVASEATNSPQTEADAVPASADSRGRLKAPMRSRLGRMAGVTMRGHKWQAAMCIGLSAEGRASGAADRVSRAAGSFVTIQEAGIARDLAIAWRQLALGAPLEAASEAYNARLPILQQEAALLAQLQRCPTWDELRALLQLLTHDGKLARLADRLLPPELSAAAAAAAAAQSRAADLTVGKRLRARAAIKYEDGADEEGSEEEEQRQAKRRKREGQEAVGRCIQVWLGDDGSRQLFSGLVAECTPSGKHHVLFTDGEEALMDFDEEDVQFIECPSEAAAVEAAARAASKLAPAAAAAAKRDKGQRLCVLWPDGVWWSGKITHAVGTGLHCIRYDEDNAELLVDVMEEQVKWDCAERQREHERQLRQYRREQRAAGKDGPASSRDGSMAAAAAEQAPDSTPRPAKRGRQQQQPEEETCGSGQAGGRQRKQQRPAAEPAPALAKIKAEAEEAAMGPIATPAAAAPAEPGSPGGQSAATAMAGRAAAHATPAAATPAAPAASGPVGGGASAAGQGAAAPEQCEVDLFDYMMDCAETPGADAAGLTGELVCQYQELLDALPPPARSAKEERLRKQLAAGKLGNAAAMMKMAVNLALGKQAGL